MGNYLHSLRAPLPLPDEEERNHPLYYDWSVKWSPFRQDTGECPPAALQAPRQSADRTDGRGATSDNNIVVAARKSAALSRFDAYNANSEANKTQLPTGRSSGARLTPTGQTSKMAATDAYQSKATAKSALSIAKSAIETTAKSAEKFATRSLKNVSENKK